MKPYLLPIAALALLSACSSWGPKSGVGFTGIDGEPKTFSETPGSAGYVTRARGIPVELAQIPTVRLQSDADELQKLAKVAINNGGRTQSNAVEVGGDTRTLMLSTVQVNQVLFAVLRTPDSDFGKIDPATGSGFASSVPRLTGCLPAGNVYARNADTSRASNGYAIPLNCR